ncbi:hypothetical protein BLL36_06860 [Pseudomonas cedrina subsp. cedrina]|uniref:Uncharacterized protein n=1 Tax=Pseudomonas cedrina subsp. cedrina TaxID=76762 RepID=A0A1V2KE08_PSECE|nr:hypothetical protein BLL36_06860 [Pseudomonas cedrina subsp. cedrina]
MSLCLACLCFAGSSIANETEELHQTALTAIAMEQVCTKANPGMNASIENAFANDLSMEKIKPEVRKVQSDPTHKAEVAAMVNTLSAPPFQSLQKQLCGAYAPK